MTGLPIRDVAEQTGLAAGTIRMWEQRYGFPTPERTPSGYRVYSEDDVEMLRRVVELRRGGLSVLAALERARSSSTTEHPSIFGAVPHEGRSRRLRKKTLIAMARATSLASQSRWGVRRISRRTERPSGQPTEPDPGHAGGGI